MNAKNASRILAVSFLLLAATAHTAWSQQPGDRAGQATAVEVMQLPQFCWWEFDARYARTRQLIQNCGVGMNHYCVAEVSLIRSKGRSKAEYLRKGALQHALRETEYTLQWMEQSPACSIRNHVTRKYAEIRSAHFGLGMPIPPDRFRKPSR